MQQDVTTVSNKPRRWWRVLRRWLLFITFLWLVMIVLLKWFENRLVYPASSASESWIELPIFENIWLDSTDGNRIHAWYLPAVPGAGVILICHGNGGNLSHRGDLALKLRAYLKCSVLLFDYPGYGKSTGKPNEQACYASGEAAIDWLKKRNVDNNNLIIYGESLGGGVAVELATRHPPKALVLVKTFTSLPDAAKEHFSFLPVKTLMSNRYDSMSKIGKVKSPVFVAHGEIDSVVPYKLGRSLFDAANEPKRFYDMDNHDHNLPMPEGFYEALKLFLNK